MITSAQNRADVVRRLHEVEANLRTLGVRRLALFGSFARSEGRPDSDVDLLVEFDAAQKTFDGFMSLCDLLEARLGRSVDVVTTEGLSPFIGPRILAEAVEVLCAVRAPHATANRRHPETEADHTAVASRHSRGRPKDL